MSNTVSPEPTKRFQSLTVTLAFAFLALSFFVLLLATTLQLYFSYQSQKAVIRNQQQLVAESAAREVSDFLEEKFRILEQAADINALATSNDRHDLVLNKLIGRDPSFRQIQLIDQEGQVVYKVARLVGTAANPIDALKDEMLASVLQGKRYTSEIYIDDTTSEPLMLLAISARDSFREPRAAFVAEVNLKFMWDLVSHIEVGTAGLAYVIDRDGNLIAMQDISRVLAHENVSELTEASRFKQGIHDPDADISTGILGKYVVSSHEPLGTPDWAVVVERPVLVAYAVVIQTLWYSLAIIVLSSVLAIVSGIYISRRITRGIIRLSKAAEEISQGKLNTVIEIAPENIHNEIGQLASSFGVMTIRLRALYEGMDEKIKERTTQLDSKVAELESFNKLMIDRELKMIELKKQIEALQKRP